MRLIVFDRPTDKRINFYPLALCRPIFELRCGMTSLLEKLIAKFAAKETACFVPPYLAEVYRAQSGRAVNDIRKTRRRRSAPDRRPRQSRRVELGRHRAEPSRPRRRRRRALRPPCESRRGESENRFARKPARIGQGRAAACAGNHRHMEIHVGTRAGQSGANHGRFPSRRPQRHRRRRSKSLGRFAAARKIFTSRPARKSIRWPFSTPSTGRSISTKAWKSIPSRGSKARATSARIRSSSAASAAKATPSARCAASAAKSKASILHGYSNKYHDGFLGHAYVGQWVNLGAMTDQQRFEERLLERHRRARRPPLDVTPARPSSAA